MLAFRGEDRRLCVIVDGAISVGALTPILVLLSEAGDYATFKFQPITANATSSDCVLH